MTFADDDPMLTAAENAFLATMPAERRDELRAMLIAAREHDPHQTVFTAEEENHHGAPAAPEPASLPAMTRDDIHRLADGIIRAALRQPDPPLTPLHTVAAEPFPSTQHPAPSTHPLTPLDTETSNTPRRHAVRLSEIDPVPLRWLSPGRIAAGKLTLLDGDPGVGKSTLLCELAARVTRGEPLPGGAPATPRAVVLFSAEDDLHDTIRPRIDAAGGDPRRVISVLTVPDAQDHGRPLAIPEHAPLLEAVIAHASAALVIIDPLVAFLSRRLRASSDQDMRRALGSLRAVGERTGVAIVAVRHLNKSAGDNPLYRGGGSIGIIGAARGGLLLAPDPDDPQRRILAVAKGNYSRPVPSLAFRLEHVPDAGVARVVWEGETHWTARTLLHAAGQDEETVSQRDDARRWLRQTLAAGPRPARAMLAEAEARGISKTTLNRARRAERIVTRKDRNSKDAGWSWSLPDAPAEDAHLPAAELLDTLDTLDTLQTPPNPADP